MAFLFRANFNAANQSIGDQLVLQTQDKGVQDGILLGINSAADTLSISSNDLLLGGAGTVWSPGYSGYFLPATKALAVHAVVDPASAGQGWLGSNGSQYPGAQDPPGAMQGFWFQGGNINASSLNAQFQTPFTYTAGVDTELMLVWGGSDANGVPWDGASSWDLYNYGFNLFQYSGGAWTMLFQMPFSGHLLGGNYAGANDSIVPIAGAQSFGSSATMTVKSLVVQDADFSGVLNPVYRDTSPALNSAYTAGAGNQLLRFQVTTLPSAGAISVRFRRADASNYWAAEIDSSGNLTLKETVAGTTNTRGTSAAAVANGNHVEVFAQGTNIGVWSLSSASNAIVYTSASSSQTATGVLIGSLGTGGVLAFIAGFNNDAFGANALPPAMASVSFASPPSTNPSGGSAVCQLSIDGDSIPNPDALNRGDLGTYLPQLMGGSWTISNFAVTGSTIADLVSREAAVNASYKAGNVRNELVIWAGTNDGYTLGHTGATAAADMQSYLTTMRAVGWKITFLAMLDRQQTGGNWPPSGTTANMNTFRSAYNSAMLTFCNANNIRYLDPTQNGQMTDSTNANYFRNDPIGVHPGYYSEGIVARQIYDLVGNLVPPLETLSTVVGFASAEW